MAFRDTWHRALVYFGLAEDHDPYDDEDEPYEPEAGARGPLPRAPQRPPPAPRAAAATRSTTSSPTTSPPARPTTSLRPVAAPRRQRRPRRRRPGAPRHPQELQRRPAGRRQVQGRRSRSILNLQTTDTELSKRLIDFASGLTYALDGGMQRIADKVFMLTPRNVEVSAEERAQLIEKGFFNQS